MRFRLLVCVCSLPAEVSGEAEASDGKVIKLTWFGSRAKGLTPFEVKSDDTLKDFKNDLYLNFYGCHLDCDEKDFTDNHHLMMAKSFKVYSYASKTFGELGFVPSAVPYEITFSTGLGGGMGKRATALMVSKRTD